jgi:hypothetical protein
MIFVTIGKASIYREIFLRHLAAIRRGTPLCRAIEIARSTPFSGDIRARNAKYCGLAGRGINSCCGKPS